MPRRAYEAGEEERRLHLRARDRARPRGPAAVSAASMRTGGRPSPASLVLRAHARAAARAKRSIGRSPQRAVAVDGDGRDRTRGEHAVSKRIVVPELPQSRSAARRADGPRLARAIDGSCSRRGPERTTSAELLERRRPRGACRRCRASPRTMLSRLGERAEEQRAIDRLVARGRRTSTA